MFRNTYSVFNKSRPTIKLRRSVGDFKVIKRPDPNKLKMPTSPGTLNLFDIIKEKIKLNGPISVAEYMNIVTTNPTEGYYMKKDVIGDSGDFITSPEISQLFGEILGVWFYSENQKLRPSGPLQIVELGPGKGTLLLDILRVISRLGYNSKDLSLHLVEVSATMQDVQANCLCMSHRPSEQDSPHYYEGETVSGCMVYWYDDLKKVPPAFSWFIAHEFFDVLPIHKFQKTENGWREIQILLDDNGNLQYCISPEETMAVKMFIRSPVDDGEKKDLEISSKGLTTARQLAERVDQDGGITLIADYGHGGEKGDTFRAFHKHKLVNPLENPGLHDLTADVDFSQLRLAASEIKGQDNYALVYGPVSQADFLKRSQADVRLQVLVDNAAEEDREHLKLAYDMLTNPQKMGERFKFMAFYPSALNTILEKYPPLGFV